MTTIGELNRRLTLEAPVETNDGAGGVVRGYQAVATLWAQVAPLRARGDVAADSLGAVVTHRIVIRTPRVVSTLHRLRDGERTFRIVSYRETADRRFLEIEVEEREA